ncbi:uncharacterized protein METZ01_LOCUS425461, partial [marine metagenome]
MKLILSIILSISFSWGIGLTGLIIPENSYVLSTAGAGIAEGLTPALNPAMNVSKYSYIQFSLNRWLGDIKGSHTAYHWGREIPQTISVQSWSATDLELWDKPNFTPLGTFGVHYVSAAYSISHHFNTSYRFGIRFQANYIHLFTESMSGITLDAGALFPFSSFLTAGVVVRNMGYENTNNLRSELPGEIGFGTELKLPFKISILTDVIYLSEKGTDIRFGARTHFKWLNIHAGTSMHEKRNA